MNSDLVQSSNTYSITSGTNTLNVSDASFTILDVGKTISIYGAGVNGDDLETTIIAVNSGTNVTIATNASTTVSNVGGFYGTDNTQLLLRQITQNNKIILTKGNYYFKDPIVLNDVDNWSIDFNNSNIYFNSFFNASWGEGYNDGSERNLFEITNCDNVKFENAIVDYIGQTSATNDSTSYVAEFNLTVNVQGSEVVITSNSSVFQASDVNKILRFQITATEFYYLYISEFNSASQITCRDGGGFNNPSLGGISSNFTNIDGDIFSEDGYTGIIGSKDYDRRYNKRGNTGAFVIANNSTCMAFEKIIASGIGRLFAVEGNTNQILTIDNCELNGFGNVGISPCDYTSITNCRFTNKPAQSITDVDQRENLGTTHVIYTTQAYQNVIVDDNDILWIRGVAIQWNTGSSGKSKGHFVTNNYVFECQRAGTIQGSADWEIHFSNNKWENCGQWSVNSSTSSIYISGDTWVGEPTEQNQYLGAWGVSNASYFELKNSTINGVFTGTTGTDVGALSFSMQSATDVRDIDINVDNNIFINNTNDLQFVNEQFALTTGNEIKIKNNEFLGNVYLVKNSTGTYRQANLEEYILFKGNNFYGTTFIRMGASFIDNNFIKIGNSDLALNIDMLDDAGASGERDLILNENKFERIGGSNSNIIELSAVSDSRVYFNYNEGIDESCQIEMNGGSFISRDGLYRNNNGNYFISSSSNTIWTLETDANSYLAINFLKNDGNYWKMNTQSTFLSGALVWSASGNSSPSSGVRMSLTTGGNLGIGLSNTATASERLQVRGNIMLDDNSASTQSDIMGNNDMSGTITINATDTGSYSFAVAKTGTGYHLGTSLSIVSGTPTGNELVYTVTKGTNSITITLQESLDAGEEVSIDWILIR